MERNKMNRKVLALTLVLGLLVATALAVYAEDATVTITGGSLSETANNVALSGVTLDGADQTSTSAFDSRDAWTVIDPRGTGGGWNVTIASTDFDDGGSNTIDISAAGSLFEIQITAPHIGVTAGSAEPTSSVLTLASIADSTLKILTVASGGAGMGSYTYQPNFALGVPAETYAASYTAELTLSLTTGP
jgi:hypothetical protein